MKLIRVVAAAAMIALTVGLSSPLNAWSQASDRSSPASRTTSTSSGSFVPNILPSITVPRKAEVIQIDGDLSDVAWEYAAVAGNFSENFPDEQTKPPIGISVRITYDDANMYIAYEIEDDPGAIEGGPKSSGT